MWESHHRGVRSLRICRGCMLFFAATLAIFHCFEQVSSMPAEVAPENAWPQFLKRNVAALARDGYLKSFKRSISTLAKNGQLPTFTAPNDAQEDHEDVEDSQEKRHIGTIARMRSYAYKRNVQALARDGFRFGRASHQSNEKRTFDTARNGYKIIKKNDLGDEYYFPFYQNQVPPLSEIDGPFDANEVYDYQQSVNPDMFPPMSQVFKRASMENGDDEGDYYVNRGVYGMPMHGLYRPTYVEGTGRSKRYILTLPDHIEENGIDADDANDHDQDDKRSVGSIPMTRISELGSMSLIPKLTQKPIQTTPTYRRRHYLLTRTQQAGFSGDR